MNVKNPGPGNKVPIFGGCYPPGVYDVLITPVSGAQRDTNGRIPHILYEVSGNSAGLDYQNAFGGTAFDPNVDKSFEVEFDAGTFAINSTGTISITGGDPAGVSNVKLFRRVGSITALHWHRLTTKVLSGTNTTIPDYHTRIAGWASPAGLTLEGMLITIAQYPLDCAQGTTLANPAGVDIMIATEWWG